MPEEISSTKFGLEDVKPVTNAVKEIVKDSKIDDKWVRMAELGDSIVKNLSEMFKARRDAVISQNQGVQQQAEQKAVAQNQTAYSPRQLEVTVQFKSREAIKDLIQILKTQEVIPQDATLSELLNDKVLTETLEKDFVHQKIQDWFKKYSEVTY